MTPAREPLRVLVVDDERPALDELQYLLQHDARIGEVVACDSATEALRTLHEREVDAVFLDIQMPGLTGLELAQVLKRFRVPPPVVFVTAHEEHAVDAFELHAVDYVLKPVREDRLAEAIRRVIEGGDRAPAPAEDVQIPVELGGVTRFVDRSDVTLRRGARRLRPAAHGRAHPPDPGAARHPRGGVGRRRLRAHPPLAAGGAAPRHRDPDGVRPLHGGGRPARRGHRAGREQETHPRAPRAARPTSHL